MNGLATKQAALAHYQELARVAMLESENKKLKLALMDARVFIAQTVELDILNADECRPMLAVYDKVLKESA